VQALLPIVIIALYSGFCRMFSKRAMIVTIGMNSADIVPERVPFHIVRQGGQYLSPRRTFSILPILGLTTSSCRRQILTEPTRKRERLRF
jgi:hypothetical protein